MSQWALLEENRLEEKKKERRRSKVLPRFVFFFIEVTSNLHVEVSMPLGNTKEAIPF